MDFDLQIQWADGHVSAYDSDWLADHLATPTSHSSSDDFIPTSVTEATMPSLDYAELFTKDPHAAQLSLWRWLEALNKEGACIIRNAPSVENTVLEVASLISEPQHTIYGKSFHVREDPKAINVAYTSVALDPHQVS